MEKVLDTTLNCPCLRKEGTRNEQDERGKGGFGVGSFPNPVIPGLDGEPVPSPSRWRPARLPLVDGKIKEEEWKRTVNGLFR
jgi:hypothetical protein